ncbi:hypothetical protein CISIN_1g0453722mg, partial [Citrus sinensis]
MPSSSTTIISKCT